MGVFEEQAVEAATAPGTPAEQVSHDAENESDNGLAAKKAATSRGTARARSSV